MLSRIINISSRASKQWKPILLIYGIQLMLGLIVAMIAYRQLDGAIGKSLELDRLAGGFDRSIFSDMVNEFPKIIDRIQSGFVIVLFLFLLVSIFLHAGLLSNIKKKEYSISTFFNNARKYYFRILGVVLISLFKMIVTLCIIWVPFFKWLGNPLETFHSEKTFILTVIGLLVLSVLLIIAIWLWSILSRYEIVEGSQFVVAMKSGWKILKSNFIRYYIVGVSLIVLHIAITRLYTYAVDDWGAETWYCVLGLILVQQIFSFVRVWIRVFGYAAIDNG